jgi:hypothetical protein
MGYFSIILFYFLPFLERTPSYDISPRGDIGSHNVGRWELTDILKEHVAPFFRVQ